MSSSSEDDSIIVPVVSLDGAFGTARSQSYELSKDEIQKLTDKSVKSIDGIVDKKEKEVMTV